MKSVLIFVLFSALKIARAVPSAKAQWGPGFDDDDNKNIDYFENEDDSCGVVWRGNQLSGKCVASDDLVPSGFVNLASSDCRAEGASPVDGSVKCQVPTIACGGSNNYCFNPGRTESPCQGNTLSFTINNNRVAYLCPDELVCCIQGASSSGRERPTRRPGRGGPTVPSTSPPGAGSGGQQERTPVQVPTDSTPPNPSQQNSVPADGSANPQPVPSAPSDSQEQPGSGNPQSVPPSTRGSQGQPGQGTEVPQSGSSQPGYPQQQPGSRPRRRPQSDQPSSGEQQPDPRPRRRPQSDQPSSGEQQPQQIQIPSSNSPTPGSRSDRLPTIKTAMALDDSEGSTPSSVDVSSSDSSNDPFSDGFTS